MITQIGENSNTFGTFSILQPKKRHFSDDITAKQHILYVLIMKYLLL